MQVDDATDAPLGLHRRFATPPRISKRRKSKERDQLQKSISKTMPRKVLLACPYRQDRVQVDILFKGFALPCLTTSARATIASCLQGSELMHQAPEVGSGPTAKSRRRRKTVLGNLELHSLRRALRCPVHDEISSYDRILSGGTIFEKGAIM